MEHSIDIECTRYGPRGPVYAVKHNGETLISACRVPAFDACRVLQAAGKAGKLSVFEDGKHRFSVDIAEGAKWNIRENEKVSLQLVPYRAFAMAPGDELEASDEEEAA